MTREIELEVLPAAIDYGVGIIPWSPLHGRNREQIESYEIFCEELGAEPGTVALAWLLHRDGVTAPIVGPRTLQHLDDALSAVTRTLDADAPEHYAW
jgi:NDP-hexose C3-ketoreductase / dTDP-4-oxo-2-deoxy-alpha-D-pentos-2-ene 2,3-reductase